MRKVLILIAIGWLVLITLIHASINLNIFGSRSRSVKFGVGFIPVTCHLTCPVTDFINKNLEGESFFNPGRFTFSISPVLSNEPETVTRVEGLTFRLVWGCLMMVTYRRPFNDSDISPIFP